MSPLRHARRGPDPGPDRSRRQAGAVLVEFALVVPLVSALCVGTFEYGMAWRSGLAVTSASRAGVRTGSSLGKDPLADYYALSALRSTLQSSGLLAGVQKVVVFRSDTADGIAPASCVAGTSGTCNLITGSQLNTLATTDFNSTTGCFTAATLKNWCPSSRNNVQLTADYYGIYLEVRHGYITNLFGSGVTIKRTSVMRLEPQVG